jgi:hypothetical protein
MPPTIDYIPITNVRFNSSGNIIKYTSIKNSIDYPAQNAGHDNAWSAGKTIFELQSAAFTDLKSAVGSGTTTETASIRLYSNAIKNIIDYNEDAAERSIERTYTESTYPQIVFYNRYNSDIDYAQYENLLKTRDFIKAKMDYINDVPGTVSNEQKGQHLNAIYMNTLVSILATSLLYFIFIHLRY